MKNFNFLNQVDPQVQKDFKNWAKYTLIILSCILVFLGALTVKKIVKLKKIKKEIVRYKSLSSDYEQSLLSTQEQTQQDNDLEKRVIKLSKWKHPKIIPVTVISDISDKIPDNIKISQISYKYKEPINIKGQAKSLIEVKSFVENLKETEWGSKAILLKLEKSHEDPDSLCSFEIAVK